MSPQRIAAIRAGLGLTHNQLARVIRLNPNSGRGYLIDLERGKGEPSGPVACALEALESGWRPAHFQEAISAGDPAPTFAVAR